MNEEEEDKGEEDVGEQEEQPIRPADAPPLNMTHTNSQPAPPTVRDRSASEERFRADRKRIISRMKKTTIRAIKSRTDDPDPSPPSSDDDDEFHDASSAPPSPAHRHPSLTVPQRRNRVPPATIDMILQRKQMLSLLGDDREVLLMRLNEPMFKSDAQTFR